MQLFSQDGQADNRRSRLISRTTRCETTYIHVVCGRAHFFKLLASEDVNGCEIALSVSVLASLGGGDVDNLHKKIILPRLVLFDGSSVPYIMDAPHQHWVIAEREPLRTKRSDGKITENKPQATTALFAARGRRRRRSAAVTEFGARSSPLASAL